MASGIKGSGDRDPAFILFGLPATARSLRGVWLMLGLYLGAMLFAAVISPWVYHLVQVWAQAFPGDLNTYLAAKRFPSYFDRIRWLPLIIGLPWLMRHCGLFPWKRLGYGPLPEGIPTLLRWFLIGVSTLAAVFVLRICLHPIAWGELHAGRITAALLYALAGALLLGLFEETVFRGLIMRLFYTAFPPAAAVWLMAAFFSYTHFKMPRSAWCFETGDPVFWWSGLPVAWGMLTGISRNFHLFTFINLTLVGWVLGLLFLRTRNLWTCVGLHAGWVTVMLLVFELADRHKAAPPPWWLGSERIVDGGLATLMLLGMGLRLTLQIRKAAAGSPDAAG